MQRITEPKQIEPIGLSQVETNCYNPLKLTVYLNSGLRRVDKELGAVMKVPPSFIGGTIMEITFIITIFLIGFIGSYISGMLGIGGSIIKYPMLLFIPPLFGLAAFSAHEVSGISAV